MQHTPHQYKYLITRKTAVTRNLLVSPCSSSSGGGGINWDLRHPTWLHAALRVSVKFSIRDSICLTLPARLNPELLITLRLPLAVSDNWDIFADASWYPNTGSAGNYFREESSVNGGSSTVLISADSPLLSDAIPCRPITDSGLLLIGEPS